MSDKLDLDLEVAHFVHVEPEALAALRVGQRLTISRLGEGEELFLFTELGVKLVPLHTTLLAASCLNSKVIIRAIKREAASGIIQKFKIRIYRGEDAGTSVTDHSSGRAGAVAGAASGAVAATVDAQAGSTAEDDHDYKLRRSQYQALADNEDLQAMLVDPHLQAVLSKIDDAPDRERALAAQLETPGFQGFVTQVLMSLDPARVPATAATAAAVAMASR